MNQKSVDAKGLLVLLITLSSIILLQGNYLPALIFSASLFLVLLIYSIKPKLDTVCLILFSLIVVLEPPAARPYYDHTSPTEMIGAIFFNSIKKISGVPIPFNFFEILSFICLAVIFVNFRHRKSHITKVVGLVGLSMPLAAILSIVVGQAKGNELGLAITQIRTFPILATWVLIGYYLARSQQNLLSIINIIKWGSAYKSIYAIGFFLVYYKGDLGEREYLIDHMSSYILGLAMVLVAAEVIFSRNISFSKLVLNIFLFLIYLIPFIINDRRTAMLGLVLITLCFPLLIDRNLLKKLFIPITLLIPFIVASIIAVVGFAFLSNSPFAQSIRAYIFAAPEQNLSYRTIENFNLFQGVRQSPITGLGFGTKYPILMKLPDISHAFKLFDAIPHNHVLYIWVFAGPIGLGALGITTIIPLIASVRLTGYSSHGILPLIGFVSFSALILWVVFVFFDMGLLAIRPIVITAIFIGGVFSMYKKYVQPNAKKIRTKLYINFA